MYHYNKEIGLFTKDRFESQEQLLVVNWNVTGLCPNSCTYCYGKDIRFMPGLSSRPLTSLVHNLGRLKPDLIVITGGEPLLFPSLNYVIDYFLKNNINLILDTSGVVHLDILKPFLSEIHTRISLDSINEKINEATRISSVSNSTCKIIEQIIMLVKAKYPVSVQTTVTDINCDYLFGLARFLTDCGVRNWRLSFVIPHAESLEQKVKPIINSLRLSFPCLNIRISNWNSESNNHVVLVDPDGNVIIRNANSNKKKIIGNLVGSGIDKKAILNCIDSQEHIRRYSLR